MNHVQSDTGRSRWVKLVAKLTELTQTGKLNWRAVSPSLGLAPTERTLEEYETTFEGLSIHLVRGATKYFVDEDRFEWLEGVRLQLVDLAATSRFEVPSVVGIPELLDAVRYRAVGVDEFLKRVGV